MRRLRLLLRLAARNVRRQARRSLLTATATVLGTAVMVFSSVMTETARIRVRGDAGFFGKRVVEFLDGERAGYALVAKEYQPIKALAQGCRPISGPVVVTIQWFRAARRGDLDNHLKVVLDALQGVAYRNDNQIVELHAYRLEDHQNPRLQIVIEDVAP